VQGPNQEKVKRKVEEPERRLIKEHPSEPGEEFAVERVRQRNAPKTRLYRVPRAQA